MIISSHFSVSPSSQFLAINNLLCLHKFSSSEHFIQMIHTLCGLCVFGFIHLMSRFKSYGGMWQYFILFNNRVIFSIVWIWIYNILFIYSSVDEHLSCCHFLAVMNNAAWTPAQVFVWTHVFSSLGYTLSNRIVGSRILMFNFLRNCWSFPKRLHHFIFPPATCKGSNFSIFLRRSSFWIQPSVRVFHCGFDLHFSNDKWYWASYLYVF